MIPKIIHYCWFGGNPLPEKLQQYLESWKKFCPDYEIKLWNENNFDITHYPFTKTAYEHKKFAYVSDYVRAYALFYEGGIYLDTDVELKANLDHLLEYEAFTGFESQYLPFTAVWAAQPKHSLSKKVLNYYDDRIYTNEELPNTLFISDIICNDFNINKAHDTYQVGFDGTHRLHVFASSYLCLDLPQNIATHHFIGSWLDVDEERKSYKKIIHDNYYYQHIKSDFLFEKNQLKNLAKQLSFKNLILIIRYYMKSKFK